MTLGQSSRASPQSFITAAGLHDAILPANRQEFLEQPPVALGVIDDQDCFNGPVRSQPRRAGS